MWRTELLVRCMCEDGILTVGLLREVGLNVNAVVNVWSCSNISTCYCLTQHCFLNSKLFTSSSLPSQAEFNEVDGCKINKLLSATLCAHNFLYKTCSQPQPILLRIWILKRSKAEWSMSIKFDTKLHIISRRSLFNPGLDHNHTRSKWFFLLVCGSFLFGSSFLLLHFARTEALLLKSQLLWFDGSNTTKTINYWPFSTFAYHSPSSQSWMPADLEVGPQVF